MCHRAETVWLCSGSEGGRCYRKGGEGREPGWRQHQQTETTSEVQAILRGDFPAEPGSAGLYVLHVALCFCR